MKSTLPAALASAALVFATLVAPAVTARRSQGARPPGEERVERTLGAMSLDEKVGQLRAPSSRRWTTAPRRPSSS